ncbi:MAG: hypothetical protein V4696_00540 [Pseudomonadota bacterium]
MKAFAAIFALALVSCATSTVNEPSLARRPAESIDPRVPIPSNPVAGPVDAVLAARLGTLVADGKTGAAMFDSEVGRAQSLAAAAGPAQSDSWVIAQEALSRLEAARAQTVRAAADIDELAASRIQGGGLSVADQAAIEASATELAAMSRRQSEAMDAISAQLSG